MGLGPGFRSRAVALDSLRVVFTPAPIAAAGSEPAGRATTASRGDAASTPDGSLKAERGSDERGDLISVGRARPSSSTGLVENGLDLVRLAIRRADGSTENASVAVLLVLSRIGQRQQHILVLGGGARSAGSECVGTPGRQRYVVDRDLRRVGDGRRIGHAERNAGRRSAHAAVATGLLGVAVACSVVAVASAMPNGTFSGCWAPTSAFGRGAKSGSGMLRAGSAAMIVSGVSFSGSGACASATCGISARFAFSRRHDGDARKVAALGGRGRLQVRRFTSLGLGAGAAAVSTSALSSASSSPPPKKADRNPPDFLVLPPALASSMAGAPAPLRAL